MQIIGQFFNAIKSLELISKGDLKEDLRKLGMVLMGGGLVTLIIKGNYLGSILILFGFVFFFFGHTQRRKEAEKDGNHMGEG